MGMGPTLTNETAVVEIVGCGELQAKLNVMRMLFFS